MFTRLSHVCLSSSNLARTVAYYEKLGLTQIFGFTRNGRDFGAYMKITDGSYVEIFEDPNMGPATNTGILHFCLETDDIEATMATLTERGVSFTPKKMGVDNSWQIWLEDPDGNRFEVQEYTAESSQFSGKTVEADW